MISRVESAFDVSRPLVDFSVLVTSNWASPFSFKECFLFKCILFKTRSLRVHFPDAKFIIPRSEFAPVMKTFRTEKRVYSIGVNYYYILADMLESFLISGNS